MSPNDYTQPIWVGFNNPRFPYARYGYLRALEPKESEILPRIPPEHKLYRELQQTKGLVLFLQGKLNEHLDKSKPKKVYKKYET